MSARKKMTTSSDIQQTTGGSSNSNSNSNDDAPTSFTTDAAAASAAGANASDNVTGSSTGSHVQDNDDGMNKYIDTTTTAATPTTDAVAIDNTTPSLMDLQQELSSRRLTEDRLNEIFKMKNISEKVEALKEFIEGVESYVKKWRSVLFENDAFYLGVEVVGRIDRAKLKLNNLQSVSVSSSTNRVASITFALDQKYIGSRDLTAFQSRIDQLFQWHGAEEKKYKAPYFPIIQSSGMGKTRLMRQYRKEERDKEENGRGVLLILCTSQPIDETAYNNIYDKVLVIPENCEEPVMSTKLGELTTRQELNEKQENVFLFDEAQHLLAQDGKPFRCIRWWLQEKRGSIHFAAVFAGTNSALANFYNDHPHSSGQSRNLSKTYYDQGSMLYEPFFDICTIGCLKEKNSTDSEYNNDYENAICYGRPLFTLMHRRGALDGNSLYSILYRMLIGQSASEWKVNKVALLSILATRVQMGSTSAAIVSTLVSQGYANLTQFTDSGSNPAASYCYFTDPVCARLAMCLMDSKWTSRKLKSAEPNIYKGENPLFWTKETMKMFANGMCTPNKGDLGEIAVALYLLFCGDILRKDADDEYKTFGVSYKKWLAVLKDPTRTEQTYSVQKTDLSANFVIDSTATATTTVCDKVSFIQLRRLHLRLPFENMISQCFLKRLYMSGTACFLYSMCPVFDIIASIQVTKQDHQTNKTNITYRALLISIKARKAFGASEIKKVFEKFDSKVSEITENRKGKKMKTTEVSCMLVLIGEEGQKAVENVSDRHVLIQVPHNDPFEVTNLVLNSTRQAEEAEIYASHDYLQEFVYNNEDDNVVDNYDNEDDDVDVDVNSNEDNEKGHDKSTRDNANFDVETFMKQCLRSAPNNGIIDYLEQILNDRLGDNSDIAEKANDFNNEVQRFHQTNRKRKISQT